MLLSLPPVVGSVEGLVVVATGVSAVSVAKVVGLTSAVAVVKLVGLTSTVAVVATSVANAVAVGAVWGSGAALIDPTSKAASNVPMIMLAVVVNNVAVFLFKVSSSVISS